MKTETLFKKLWDNDEFDTISDIVDIKEREKQLRPFIQKWFAKWGKYVTTEFLDLLEKENYHTPHKLICEILKEKYL